MLSSEPTALLPTPFLRNWKIHSSWHFCAKTQMYHLRKQLLLFCRSGCTQRPSTRWPLCFIFKSWTSHSWITKVNICRCRGGGGARWMCCRGSGTCLCPTLCRTERIRMKYWVHLWISGAERPLVGASACIFSWWKPLDGSFLLAASLNSESQKCNASWHKKKMYRGGTVGKVCLWKNQDDEKLRK